MWIIHNSKAVHDYISTYNSKKKSKHVRTYDFSTRNTSIPHKLLIYKLCWVIKEAFKSSKKSYLSIYNSEARWTNKPRKSTLAFDCKDVINLLTWLINNIYVTFGDKCFQQVIGIPMGTDCAPFMANLFLFAYEFQWIDKQRKKKNFEVLNHFKGGCRYRRSFIDK